MMNSPVKSIAFATLLAATGVQAAATLEYEVIGKPERMTARIQDEHLRMDMSNAGKATHSMVFDVASGVMLTIDHARKSYTTLTAADFERMAGMAGQASQMMQGALANMPAAQRKQMEAQMAQLGIAMPAAKPVVIPKIEVKRGGPAGEIAGYACEGATILRDGQKIGSACLAEPATLKVSAADFNTFQELGRHMAKLAKSLPAGMGAKAPQLPEIDGIPLEYQDFEHQHHSRLKSVATAAIDASLFAAPAGYTQQQPQLPGQLSGQRSGH